jgi:predicted alpha/beta-fold hydrolase
VIGQFLSNNLYYNALPHLLTLTNEKEGERLKNILEKNRSGLRIIDEQIYTPMFGFKDVNEYYIAASLTPIIQ